MFGSLLPTSRLNPGLLWYWNWRNQGTLKAYSFSIVFDSSAVYERFGANTISFLGFLSGDPVIITRSMKAAKQILSTKGHTEKPEDSTVFIG